MAILPDDVGSPHGLFSWLWLRLSFDDEIEMSWQYLPGIVPVRTGTRDDAS